jgi:hypothetical protein
MFIANNSSLLLVLVLLDLKIITCSVIGWDMSKHVRNILNKFSSTCLTLNPLATEDF